MKKASFWSVGIICLVASSLFFGCSIGRSIVREFHEKPILAKRVKVLPFMDETHLGGNLGGKFTAEFVSRMRKIPLVVLDERPFGLSLPTNLRSPRFGIVTPKDFIQKAQELGLNVLITGVLNPVDVTAKRTGIWPFRKNTRFYKVSMVVNLIDVGTGALLFTKLESRTFSSSEEEYAEDPKEFMTELIKNHMQDIIRRQISAVSDVLAETPWTGKITSVDGPTIRINGGRDVGIHQGDTFLVFSTGEWIKSLSGRPYPVHTQKVGEIVVRSVADRDATASPGSGGPFGIGQMIRLKD